MRQTIAEREAKEAEELKMSEEKYRRAEGLRLLVDVVHTF
jgi:hypothetical protein